MEATQGTLLPRHGHDCSDTLLERLGSSYAGMLSGDCYYTTSGFYGARPSLRLSRLCREYIQEARALDRCDLVLSPRPNGIFALPVHPIRITTCLLVISLFVLRFCQVFMFDVPPLPLFEVSFGAKLTDVKRPPTPLFHLFQIVSVAVSNALPKWPVRTESEGYGS